MWGRLAHTSTCISSSSTPLSPQQVPIGYGPRCPRRLKSSLSCSDRPNHGPVKSLRARLHSILPLSCRWPSLPVSLARNSSCMEIHKTRSRKSKHRPKLVRRYGCKCISHCSLRWCVTRCVPRTLPLPSNTSVSGGYFVVWAPNGCRLGPR